MSRYDNDLLDLRDLAEEWRELLAEKETALEDGDTDTAEFIDDDIKKYVDLCSEFGWQTLENPDDLEKFGNSYEPTLISENYFTDYAEQMAEDIGAIDREAGWPLSFIDWDAAAEALKMDYTSVTFDGDTYLIRMC